MITLTRKQRDKLYRYWEDRGVKLFLWLHDWDDGFQNILIKKIEVRCGEPTAGRYTQYEV